MNIPQLSKTILQSDYEYLWDVEQDKFWRIVLEKNLFDDISFIDYFKNFGLDFLCGCIIISKIPIRELISKFPDYFLDERFLYRMNQCYEDDVYLSVLTYFIDGQYSYYEKKFKIGRFLTVVKNCTVIKEKDGNVKSITW